MAGIHIPHRGGLGFVDHRAVEVDRLLRAGDPARGWRGDPRLWMQQGIVADRPKGRGRILARRLEVWRVTEEGEQVLISTWHPSEVDQVINDLILLDMRSRNVSNSVDVIDKHNEAKERDALQRYAGLKAEMEDKVRFLLAREEGVPRTRFAVQGRRRD